MKRCTKCGFEKPVSEFHRKGSGYQSRCKICNIAGRIAAYKTNRKREGARNAAWRKREYEWYNALKTNPCVDCGNIFHPVAMQWDHLPGSQKIAPVSSLMQRYKGRKLVLAEIAKCELVCANCHAVRTWGRQ